MAKELLTPPYNLGALGMAQCASRSIAVGAVAAASEGSVDVIVLPKGCLITNTIVEVVEEFDCGTPLLSVGKDASVSDLIPSGSITAGTKGFYQNSTPVLVHTTATSTTVKAKLGRTGAVGTTGMANVHVFFTRFGLE